MLVMRRVMLAETLGFSGEPPQIALIHWSEHQLPAETRLPICFCCDATVKLLSPTIVEVDNGRKEAFPLLNRVHLGNYEPV